MSTNSSAGPRPRDERVGAELVEAATVIGLGLLGGEGGVERG
jgi:hypothetical protein